MARFVGLYFENNDDADAFISGANAVQGADLVAFFAIPTQLCDCPKPPNLDRPDRKIARGQKFGWWVHRDCGKPVWGSFQSPRNMIVPEGKLSKIHVSWTLRNDLFEGVVADAIKKVV